MLTKEEKAKIMAEYGRVEINKLNGHFKQHPKDNHSNRGLLKKIGKRRDLLKYLKSEDLDRYTTLTDKLGLRR